MSYPRFPTLSPLAVFRHGEGKYERPADAIEFDVGDDLVFTTTATGRHKELPVEIAMPQADWDVFTEFINDTVEVMGKPFIYDHPIVGTAVVRLAQPEYEWKLIVGPPNAWYRVRLNLKGRFRD